MIWQLSIDGAYRFGIYRHLPTMAFPSVSSVCPTIDPVSASPVISCVINLHLPAWAVGRRPYSRTSSLSRQTLPFHTTLSILLILTTWALHATFNMSHARSYLQLHPLFVCRLFLHWITVTLLCVWIVICRRLCWCSSLAQSTWSGCGRQAAAANMQASKGAFALSGSPYQS